MSYSESLSYETKNLNFFDSSYAEKPDDQNLINQFKKRSLDKNFDFASSNTFEFKNDKIHLKVCYSPPSFLTIL